jgi:hypothetical protein
MFDFWLFYPENPIKPPKNIWFLCVINNKNKKHHKNSGLGLAILPKIYYSQSVKISPVT